LGVIFSDIFRYLRYFEDQRGESVCRKRKTGEGVVISKVFVVACAFRTGGGGGGLGVVIGGAFGDVLTMPPGMVDRSMGTANRVYLTRHGAFLDARVCVPRGGGVMRIGGGGGGGGVRDWRQPTEPINLSSLEHTYRE
jgi:hypothetical protein